MTKVVTVATPSPDQIEQAQTLWHLQRLWWAARYKECPLPIRKDDDLVGTNFQNVKIDLRCPAFQQPSSVPRGFLEQMEGPTSQAVLESFLKTIAFRNDWMTYQDADFRSEEGRNVPFVVLSSSLSSLRDGKTSNKLRVWIQGGVHGTEPAGDQSILALIGMMDWHPSWTSSILEKMDIVAIPRYNPDGVAGFQRHFASGYDPNRDHIKFSSEQTRNTKKLFNWFMPHITADMHEYTASAKYGHKYVHASDALFSAAKNLNIHPAIRRISEELFAPQVEKALKATGLRPGPYVTASSGGSIGSPIVFKEASTDGKLGRNAMGLTQCAAFLCETRGINLAEQHFQRRTATALIMLKSILETARDNSDSVLKTLNSAVDDFLCSNADIVIQDVGFKTHPYFAMIDVSTGQLLDLPVEMISTSLAAPKMTRKRPEAYLIPAAWRVIADHLIDLGHEIQTTQSPFRGTLEALQIKGITTEESYFEGVIPVTVTAEITLKEVEMPSGSFLVSTRQKNAALAFIALEPENIDSFVSSNIISVSCEDEYPIFRVIDTHAMATLQACCGET